MKKVGQIDGNTNCVSTSPSVYVNFHRISATDQCGGMIISSTMVAFASGELVTIAGPLELYNGEGSIAKNSFDLNDLPCPPQSVMVNIRRQVYHISS